MNKWHTKRINQPQYAIMAEAIKCTVTEMVAINTINYYIDLGCSIGELVKHMTKWITAAHCYGCDIFDGGEFWKNIDATFLQIDLNAYNNLLTNNFFIAKEEIKFDLITSFECAEHLMTHFPLSNMPFFETLNYITTRNSIIFFSAANASQKGKGHINNHDSLAWIQAFKNKQWIYLHDWTMMYSFWLGRLSNDNKERVYRCYRDNCLIFKRW